MTDYGRTLQFGVFATPTVELLDNTFELAALADETGLDFIGVQDHPYQAKFLDSFSLMGTLLARTERVRVFPDVACLPLRPPSVMAKAAASLDVLSGGRFELALGAGAFCFDASRSSSVCATDGRPPDIMPMIWPRLGRAPGVNPAPNPLCVAASIQ